MGINGGRRMHWVAAAVDVEAGELVQPSIMGAAYCSVHKLSEHAPTLVHWTSATDIGTSPLPADATAVRRATISSATLTMV
jgi:hypothetical protein